MLSWTEKTTDTLPLNTLHTNTLLLQSHLCYVAFEKWWNSVSATPSIAGDIRPSLIHHPDSRRVQLSFNSVECGSVPVCPDVALMRFPSLEGCVGKQKFHQLMDTYWKVILVTFKDGRCDPTLMVVLHMSAEFYNWRCFKCPAVCQRRGGAAQGTPPGDCQEAP